MWKKIREKAELIYVIPLLALSALTHFIFFAYPRAAVFDEIYFGNFILDYSNHTYFFDNHPPLGKLSMLLFARVFGLIQHISFANIGDAISAPFIYIRVLPMIAGFLLPLAVYIICRQLNMNKLVALFAGLMLVFENSFTVQSRFMLMDCLLVLFGFSSLILYFLAKRYEAKEGRTRRLYWLFFVLTAILAACAGSVKWTGFSFAGLIFINEIVDLLIHRWHTIKAFIGKSILFLLILGIVYGSFLAIHLHILTQSGPGDAFMSAQFQKTLVGNQYASDANVMPLDFADRMIELNHALYVYQASITDNHPYSSKWYTWPLMYRPIYYWEGPEDGSVTGQMIYYFGNPAVYWLSALAVLFLIVFFVWIPRQQKKRACFLIMGYLINFLPFIFIHRPMFLYHYMTALIFALLALAFLLNILHEKYTAQKPLDRRIVIVMMIILLVTIGLFIYFSPLTYGYVLPTSSLMHRFWFMSWR